MQMEIKQFIYKTIPLLEFWKLIEDTRGPDLILDKSP